jgi:hypothetical protein
MRWVALAVLVMCVAVGTTYAGALAPTTHIHGQIVLTAVPARLVDEEPPPGRGGNVERVRWSLRDRHGNTLGSGLFSCRWHMKQERLCSGELRLPLGKLTVMGTSATRSVGLWAVTGGTGRYADAGGELSYQAIGFAKLAVRITL